MVALGLPVVPEVNAIMATSSAAVATEAKSPGFWPARLVRSPGWSPPYGTTGRSGRPVVRSQVKRWSHRARVGLAISPMVASSVARSSGMVETVTAPALTTPSQQATSHGLFGPRSSTRLPGTMPKSSVSTRATWLATVSTSP